MYVHGVVFCSEQRGPTFEVVRERHALRRHAVGAGRAEAVEEERVHVAHAGLRGEVGRHAADGWNREREGGGGGGRKTPA